MASSSTIPWRAAKAALDKSLAPRGFTVTTAFKVQSYNAEVTSAGHPEWALPSFGRASTLAVLVANTKSFWPSFTSFLKAHRETWLDKAQHPNVVDEYTEMVVREAAAAAASATAPATEIRKEEDGSSSAVEAEAAEPPLQTEVRFSHNMGPSEFVHMQLAASVAGLAFKDPASMLSIHPTFGPWLSLRSVVVLDVDGSTIADPTPVKHPRPDVIPKVEARLAELLAPPPAPRPVWTDWLGLRDLVGDFEPATEHRYGEDMLEYHYSYSREALERAVDAAV